MIKKRTYYVKAVFCLIFLLVTPLVLTIPAFIRNEAPINLEGLTLRAPWQEARAPGASIERTGASDVLIERYYPWYVFLNEAGAKGKLPLWNPYEGFGVPFLALWRTRAFSPFSVPLYFLPLAWGITASILMKLIVGGLCAYFIARRFQFTPFFALMVALPFQLSGIFMVAPWHPVADVAPFFPLLLPCLQHVMLGKYRYWPCLALVIGLMTLGGSPESLAAIFCFALALIFIFNLRIHQPGGIPAALFWLALSGVAGLGLAAVQLAPYIEFLSFGLLENETNHFFEFGDIATFLIPPVLANGAFAEQASALWLPSGMVGFLLLPVWFALRSYANRVRRRRIEAMLLAALLTPLVAALSGSWLRAIPGLSILDVSHFLIPFPLALALLAATTADEWIHLNAEQCKAALKKLRWLLPLIWLSSLSAALAFLWLHGAAGFDPFLLGPFSFCALFVLLVLGVTILWPRPSFTALSLTLVSCIVLWYIYQPHSRRTPADFLPPETQFTRVLNEDTTRIAGSTQLKHWPLSPHSISQVYSPSGILLHRSNSFLTSAEENPELFRLGASSQMLLTKVDIQERFAALRPVLNIRGVLPSGAILLKDLQAHPRARIEYSGRKVAPEGPSLSLRAAGPPLLEGEHLSLTTSDLSSTEAVITESALTSITIAAESAQPGVLILADSWYPGWKAFINSNETPIFPVDIAFRGVEIREGTQTVSFEFEPDSLRFGAYVSIGALVIIVLGLMALMRMRHLEKKSHP